MRLFFITLFTLLSTNLEAKELQSIGDVKVAIETYKNAPLSKLGSLAVANLMDGDIAGLDFEIIIEDENVPWLSNTSLQKEIRFRMLGAYVVGSYDSKINTPSNITHCDAIDEVRRLVDLIKSKVSQDQIRIATESIASARENEKCRAT